MHTEPTPLPRLPQPLSPERIAKIRQDRTARAAFYFMMSMQGIGLILIILMAFMA